MLLTVSIISTIFGNLTPRAGKVMVSQSRVAHTETDIGKCASACPRGTPVVVGIL